ncbi:hypothetical protein LTR94_037441, partial [Friedmanniomyces endolithicus]
RLLVPRRRPRQSRMRHELWHHPLRLRLRRPRDRKPHQHSPDIHPNVLRPNRPGPVLELLCPARPDGHLHRAHDVPAPADRDRRLHH